MIFEANRLIMHEAAKNAAKIAPAHAHLEALNGILVESNADTGEIYMTATNHKVSIQQKIVASVGQSGSMLINPRLLADMTAKLNGDFVTLSAVNPHLLKVSGGRCVFQINCSSSENYPKPIMTFPEESVIMTGICSLVKRTVFATSDDDDKPALQCVRVQLKNNAVHAAACDGNRMMLIRDAAEPTDEREFLLPGRSLQLLSSVSKDDDVFEVGEIGNQVVFVRGDMIFTIRKLNTGAFVDTTKLVKSIKAEYTAVVDVNKMKAALGLISVDALAGNTRVPMNMLFSGGEIVMRCDSEFGKSSSSIPATFSKDTPSAGFFYDVSALLKLFQVVSGRVKIELDSKGFMMIKTQNEVYCQGPVRPPKKQEKCAKEENCAKGAEDVKEAA